MSSKLLKLAVTALVASVPTFAIQYTDFDLLNGSVGPNQYFYGTFNLLTSGTEANSATFTGYAGDAGGNGTFADAGGFALGSDVTDASVSFWFSDPQGGTDDGHKIRIKVSTFY